MSISIQDLVSMLAILGVTQTAKEGAFHQIAQEAAESVAGGDANIKFQFSESGQEPRSEQYNESHNYWRLSTDAGQTWTQDISFNASQSPVSRPRVWRNVIEERTKGAWYLNNSGNEMEVHMTTDHVDEGGGICVYMRPDGDSPHLTFYGQFALSGFPNSSVLNITVPDGWQYHLTTDNMGQTRQITSWLELS